MIETNTLPKTRTTTKQTFQYAGAIESYAITNKITTTSDIKDALNTNYSTQIQNTYLASLFVAYFFDSIADEYCDYYNVTYNHTSTITTVGSTITLTATITDNDKTINTGKIVFKINGKQ